jgi:hypothetical protein
MKKVINGIITDANYYSIRKDGNKLSEGTAERLVSTHAKKLRDFGVSNDFYGLLVSRKKRKVIQLLDVKNFIVKDK